MKLFFFFLLISNSNNLLSGIYPRSKNKEEVATFKMNLKGQMVLIFKDEQNFLFKRKGLLNSKYTIESANGLELIRFTPSFDWNKLSYDIAYEDKPDILLVLTGMFCTNYYMALSGGAVTATI